jgi:hypothetical protein
MTILRIGIASYEREVLNRTGVIVPAEDWEAFAAWLNRPAEIIPALAELARITPIVGATG